MSLEILRKELNYQPSERQIIIDTETTGMRPEDGHRIIEIGGVEIIDRRLTGNNFHVYINPERLVDEEAFKVHGISNDFLADKPVFEEVANKFLAFVSDAELIAHNAPFDTNFINHEFKWLNNNYSTIQSHCQITDTLAIAKKLHPGQRNNLDVLCKRYQVNNSNRTFHGALLDAELLAYVYLAMTGGQNSLFSENKPQNRINTLDIAEIHGNKNKYLDKNLKLKIIQTTPHELEDHEAYLTELKSKGVCVWQDQTSQD